MMSLVFFVFFAVALAVMLHDDKKQGWVDFITTCSADQQPPGGSTDAVSAGGSRSGYTQ